MIIEASTRPKNLKKGVSLKKFHQSLGFPDEVGLTKFVGRIGFSGESPEEFEFLVGLYKAFFPPDDMSYKITVEIDGKPMVSYTRKGVE